MCPFPVEEASASILASIYNSMNEGRREIAILRPLTGKNLNATVPAPARGQQVSISGDDAHLLTRYWEGLGDGASIVEPLQTVWRQSRLLLLARVGASACLLVRADGRVVLLDVYSPYFSVWLMGVCGLPSVTLTGTVRSWVERQDAVSAAWSAPGVSNVIDRIHVHA